MFWWTPLRWEDSFLQWHGWQRALSEIHPPRRPSTRRLPGRTVLTCAWILYFKVFDHPGCPMCWRPLAVRGCWETHWAWPTWLWARCSTMPPSPWLSGSLKLSKRFHRSMFIRWQSQPRQMEEVDGVAEYRDRLLALPCLKETSYPRYLSSDEFHSYDFGFLNRYKMILITSLVCRETVLWGWGQARSKWRNTTCQT